MATHHDLTEQLVFQEYVEGLSDRMYIVGVYVTRDHEVLGMFTGRKVRRLPPDIGDCRLGQVEEVPFQLKCTVNRLW